MVGNRLISILARTKRVTFPAINANPRVVLCIQRFFPAEVTWVQARTIQEPSGPYQRNVRFGFTLIYGCTEDLDALYSQLYGKFLSAYIYQNMAEDHAFIGVGECHPYREFEGMQPSI
jgi:hypothetical protein